MSYPDELLPKSNYKECIDTNDLVSYACCLIRRSLKTQEETFDNIGQIRIDAVCEAGREDELYGLSHNVFGIFTEDHLKYRVPHQINPYWDLKTILTDSLSENDYKITDSSVALFVSIPDIHDKIFPHKQIIKNKQTEITVSGRCLVIHKPNVYNYWHFELHFQDYEGNPVKKSDSGWKIDAAKNFIKNVLVEFISDKSPTGNIFPKEIYER